MTRHSRFCIPVLLLTSILLASPASAAVRGPAAGWLEAPGNLLSGLWQSVLKLVPAVAASRGGMDPDGQPATTSEEGDSRGTMDPDGQPTSTTTGEEGDSRYGMDPDGRT